MLLLFAHSSIAFHSDTPSLLLGFCWFGAVGHLLTRNGYLCLIAHNCRCSEGDQAPSHYSLGEVHYRANGQCFQSCLAVLEWSLYGFSNTVTRKLIMLFEHSSYDVLSMLFSLVAMTFAFLSSSEFLVFFSVRIWRRTVEVRVSSLGLYY